VIQNQSDGVRIMVEHAGDPVLGEIVSYRIQRGSGMAVKRLTAAWEFLGSVVVGATTRTKAYVDLTYRRVLP
jgi:hypothetical protein